MSSRFPLPKTIATLGLCVGLAAVFSGCASPERELESALNASDQRNICLDPGELGLADYSGNGRLYLVKDPGGASGDLPILDALKKKGFVASEPFMVQMSRWSSEVPGYAVTDKGRRWFHEGKPVCLGERTVTKIVKVTGPGDGDASRISRAEFRYEVEFNDLVDELDMADDLTAKLNVSPVTELDGAGTAVFVRTDDGWQPQFVLW